MRPQPRLALLILGLAAAATQLCPQQEPPPSMAEVLETGGIERAIEWYGSELDTSLIAIAQAHNAAPTMATRVVPLRLAETGEAIAAAQVLGPAEHLGSVVAVAAVDREGFRMFEVVFAPGTAAEGAAEQVGVCGLVAFP